MFDKVITEAEHSETTSAVTLSFLITSVVLIYYIMDRFKDKLLSPAQVDIFNEYYKTNKLLYFDKYNNVRYIYS